MHLLGTCVWRLSKIAIIALISNEVRTTCCKIPWNFPAEQMIKYQFNLRLKFKMFSVYIFEPIYHLIGQTNSFEPVMYVKSRLLDVWYYKNTNNPANEKVVAFGVRFLYSWADRCTVATCEKKRVLSQQKSVFATAQRFSELLIRLNRFFHLEKNRNRSNRFFAIYCDLLRYIAIYCDFLRFFSWKSNYTPGKDWRGL